MVIKMDLKEIDREGVNCMHLAQDRDTWQALVNTVMNLRSPHIVGNFFTG